MQLETIYSACSEKENESISESESSFTEEKKVIKLHRAYFEFLV
jgi:hypothetical protein